MFAAISSRKIKLKMSFSRSTSNSSKNISQPGFSDAEEPKSPPSGSGLGHCLQYISGTADQEQE